MQASFEKQFREFREEKNTLSFPITPLNINPSLLDVAAFAGISRVTISGEAKIGTMDGHFARDQIYGPFKFFFNKIGTLKFSPRLDLGGRGRASKRIKKGGRDLQKKKGHCLFACTFCVIFRPKIAQHVRPNRLCPFFFFWRSLPISKCPA